MLYVVAGNKDGMVRDDRQAIMERTGLSFSVIRNRYLELLDRQHDLNAIQAQSLKSKSISMRAEFAGKALDITVLLVRGVDSYMYQVVVTEPREVIVLDAETKKMLRSAVLYA